MKRLRGVCRVPSTRATVARHLAADGRGRPTEHAGHGPRARNLQLHALNRHSLLRPKLVVPDLLFHGRTLNELRWCTSNLRAPVDSNWILKYVSKIVAKP